MLEIDILNNSLQNFWDVLKGGLCGFGCPYDALLAKTMFTSHDTYQKCLHRGNVILVQQICNKIEVNRALFGKSAKFGTGM